MKITGLRVSAPDPTPCKKVESPMIDWVNPAATLIASFGGAWAAFKLQSWEKARETDRGNINAINRAITTLLEQANTLKLFQRDHIEPNRQNPGRHLAMRPLLPFDLGRMQFDFASLDFLSTASERQTVFNLSIEEQRFAETLKAINARSDLILTEVDPRLAAAGFEDGGSYGADEFMRVLGQPLHNKLERLTNDVIDLVDKSCSSLMELKDELRAVGKGRYPRQKFIDFVFPVEKRDVP